MHYLMDVGIRNKLICFYHCKCRCPYCSDAKQLKELQVENRKLKVMVADQALDIVMLKELAEGKF